MKASTASVEVQNLVFSKWIEVKHKAEPHNYIEFFLVTDTGNEVLAISAEDHGNSHYVYQSTGAFAKYGALNSKNRADTISWLEMIIKESQIKVDRQLAEEMAHAGEPTPDNPLGLYYTHHKSEKTVNPDGTHRQRFFLLDQYSTWHLAVIGEERETRDGHYVYKATEEFAARYPLSCHAQKDVIHWLEQRVTHGISQPPPLLPSQQRRTGASGGASAAVSGAGASVAVSGAAAASEGSAEAWGPTGTGMAYSSAATPTSVVDGVAGGDGAGVLVPQVWPGDLSLRHLTPPLPAGAPGDNQQQQPQAAPPLPELLPQQPQLLPPQHQVPGLSMFPAAVASSGGAFDLHQLHHQQQQSGAAPAAAMTGGASEAAGEPPPSTLPALAHQALPNTPPAASAAPTSSYLPNHGEMRPVQAGQHEAAGHVTQRQPLQNGAQEPYQHHHTQQQQQPVPRMFAGNTVHGTAVATASASAAGLASELPKLSFQQQQLDVNSALPQRGMMPAVPTAPQSQQEAGSQIASATPPQPQLHFPMLLDPPLHLRQQLPQGQQGSQAGLQAEPQGLAQLLGLAGLAASMQPSGGMAPQLPSDMSHLPLQLPLPPQLQLQGSNGSQLATPLQQQPTPHFMLPNLFQQPQQPLLPLQQVNAQTQQDLQLLQQQLQQQSQHLQQLLQSASGGLPPNSIGGPQQQAQGFLGGGGVPQLSHPGAALNALPGLSSGSQPWNAGGGFTPAPGGAPQQSLETPAVPPSSDQAGMPHPLQLPGFLPGDLSARMASTGLNALGTVSAGLVGALQGPSLGQQPAPRGQSTDAGGAAASGAAAAAATDRQVPDQVGASAAGGSGNGFGMGAWPAGMATAAPPGSFGNLFPPQPHPYPYPQQPQLQPFGQPGGVANTGAEMCGGPGAVGGSVGASGGPALGLNSSGGSAALGFGGAPLVMGSAGSTGAAAPPASPVTSLPGGFGEAGASSGLAGSAAAAAGPSLQPPSAGAGAQDVPPDLLLPAGRTKEAGPGHHGGRGGAGGRGSSGKHKLAGVAEVAHKRKLARLAAAGEEAVRLAQGAYLASLRHQALSEAAQQEALRKTIASWVRGQISDDEVSVSGWHESLQQMLRDGSRNRTMTVPFLPNDCLLELTRGSAEAITLAAAVSLAAPYDPKGQPRTPGPPGQLPAVPVSLSGGGAAAAGMPPAGLASGCSAEAAGGGRGTGGGAAALPGAGLPSSAEQMAALSSLKALLEGNLQAAVLGSIGAAAAAGPGSDDPRQAGGGNAVDSGVPTRMDVDGEADGDGQSGMGAAAQQADVHMADASAAATSTPSAGAGSHVLGAAAETLAAGLPWLQPPAAPQVPSLPPEPPAATAPQPAQQPQQLQLLSVVPQRPAGPVGCAAVVACAGSAKSWAFADPHLNRHGVRIALESLREVAALCPPVADMASSNLVETVKQFESHPHPSVSGLAKEILKRWRGALIHRLRSMSDSRCYQDPVAALESKIQANEIIFPSINELLGGPRSGSAAPSADGATPSGPAPTPAGAVPYTPSGPALTGSGGGFAAYTLAATPATAGEGQGLSCLGLPATPSLTLNAAGTPALTTAGTTVTLPATITPAGGLSDACGATPGPNPTAITSAETLGGLFDAAAASGTNGAGSFPTPQLFSRPGGVAGPIAPEAPAVQPMQLSPQPATPLFAPMSPPATAAAAPAAVAPSPPPPAAANVPPPAPTAATSVLPPPPAAANVTPPSPARAVLSAATAASAPSPRATAAAAPPTSAGNQLQQPHRLTPGKAPSLSTLPQPPSPARPPPPASPLRTAVAAAPSPAPAAEPMVVSRAAVLPMPSPGKLPAAAQTATAAALPPPSLAEPLTAVAPAGAVGPTTVAGPVAAVAPAAPLPPPPPSGGTSGSTGPLAVPLFGSPLTFLPGSPSPPQATTAEVAALLAASAQTLAAHIQTAAAGGSSGGMGGASTPPPASFSPAQLNQLGALASTTKLYASALKSSDSVMAASAWQSLVQQLRQAQALSLGLGLGLGTCSLGGLPLFIPSPSPSALASGAPSTSGQLPLLAAAWPSATWTASFQPLPTQLPLQIQPLQVQPMPSPAPPPPPPPPPPPLSTGHPRAVEPAPQVPSADGGVAARGSLPSVSGAGAAAATEPQAGAEAAPVIPPDVRTQAAAEAAATDTQPDAEADDAAAPTMGAAGTPPPPGGLTASGRSRQVEGEPSQPVMPPSLPASSADAADGPHVNSQDGASKAVGGAGGGCAAEGALEEGAPAALADGAGSVAAGALGEQQGGVVGQQQQEHGGPAGSGSGAAGQDEGVENAPSAAGEPSVRGLQIPAAAEPPAERD